jgi:uncharacterized protein YeaO (DUF488 family)
MGIRIFRAGSPRQRNEGLRLGTVRFLPRGVRKQDYVRLNYFDVWLPLLAPSRELVHWAMSRKEWDARTKRTFYARYSREMSATDARQVIQFVAALSRRTDVSVGCYCENPAHCHRSALLKLIKAARKSKG